MSFLIWTMSVSPKKIVMANNYSDDNDNNIICFGFRSLAYNQISVIKDGAFGGLFNVTFLWVYILSQFQGFFNMLIVNDWIPMFFLKMRYNRKGNCLNKLELWKAEN